MLRRRGPGFARRRRCSRGCSWGLEFRLSAAFRRPRRRGVKTRLSRSETRATVRMSHALVVETRVVLLESGGFCFREVSPTLLPSVDEQSGGIQGTARGSKHTSPTLAFKKVSTAARHISRPWPAFSGRRRLIIARGRLRYHNGRRRRCPTARARAYSRGVGLAAACVRRSRLSRAAHRLVYFPAPSR